MILILGLIFLFINRIKNTKNAVTLSVNQDEYYDWQTNRVITYFKNHDTKTINFIMSQKKLDFLNDLIVYVFYIFLTSVYLLTLIRVDNITITILTIIQLIATMIHFIVGKYEGYNIEKYFNDEKYLYYNSKIYFWYFRIDNIFNIILDYVYYPITIIWLLVH